MVDDGNIQFEAGVFLVDKPEGISSFKVVAKMRRVLGIKKVGHAGTLDPFATGLLVVCAGRPATKLISQFMDGEKEYFATMLLGVTTRTQDTEGDITARHPVESIGPEDIEKCFENFRGTIEQVPPAFSALKHKGKPLYHYARKGIEIIKDPRKIHIRALERSCDPVILNGETAELQIRVVCSKGTYIRTLASDIGDFLGCGAHLIQLRRTASGMFNVNDSISWQELNDEEAYNTCINRMMSVEDVAKLLQ
jgi:tRNA pseudouridine55 synthase